MRDGMPCGGSGEEGAPRVGEGMGSEECAEEGPCDESEGGVGAFALEEGDQAEVGRIVEEERAVSGLERSDDIAVGVEGLEGEHGGGLDGLGDGGSDANEAEGGVSVFAPLIEEEHPQETRGKQRSVETSGVRMGLCAKSKGFLGEAFGVVEKEEGSEQGAFESATSGGLLSGVFPDLACERREIGRGGIGFDIAVRECGGKRFLWFKSGLKESDDTLGLRADKQGLIAIRIEEELLSARFVGWVTLQEFFGESEQVAKIGTQRGETKMRSRCGEIVKGEGAFVEGLSDGVPSDHADQSARDSILSVQGWAFCCDERPARTEGWRR